MTLLCPGPVLLLLTTAPASKKGAGDLSLWVLWSHGEDPLPGLGAKAQGAGSTAPAQGLGPWPTGSVFSVGPQAHAGEGCQCGAELSHRRHSRTTPTRPRGAPGNWSTPRRDAGGENTRQIHNWTCSELKARPRRHQSDGE